MQDTFAVALQYSINNFNVSIRQPLWIGINACHSPIRAYDTVFELLSSIVFCAFQTWYLNPMKQIDPTMAFRAK